MRASGGMRRAMALSGMRDTMSRSITRRHGLAQTLHFETVGSPFIDYYAEFPPSFLAGSFLRVFPALSGLCSRLCSGQSDQRPRSAWRRDEYQNLATSP